MKALLQRIDPNTRTLLKQVFWGVLSLLIVAGLLYGAWHGTRLPRYTIDTIAVSGGETISHELVKEVVWSKLEGEYIGFIPRTFTWTYPKDEIMNAINNVPRVYNVQVSRENHTELAVSFSEYIPFALWCEGLESTDCMFIDSSGYAFAHAPVLQGGALPRFSHVSQSVEVGSSTVASDSLEVLNNLATGFDSAGFSIRHIELDITDDAYFHVVGGGEFKVTLFEPATSTLDNLAVILASDDFAHIEPGNFAYIDLRFGNKVFVNENLATPEVEVASSSASSTVDTTELDDE